MGGWSLGENPLKLHATLLYISRSRIVPSTRDIHIREIEAEGEGEGEGREILIYFVRLVYIYIHYFMLLRMESSDFESFLN